MGCPEGAGMCLLEKLYTFYFRAAALRFDSAFCLVASESEIPLNYVRPDGFAIQLAPARDESRK